MKFIVMLCVLGLERYLNIGVLLHRFSWFDSYLQGMRSLRTRYHFLAKLGGMSELLLLVLPLPLILLVICCLTSKMLNGFVHFLISLLVLLYCLGPNSFFQEFKETQGVGAPASKLFLEANKRIFGVLLWYVLLGPCAALLYRLVVLVSEKSEVPTSEAARLNKEAHTLQGWLDWLPARFFSLGYVLMGYFSKSFPFWIDHVLTGSSKNEELLIRCGQLALDSHSVVKNGDIKLASLPENQLLIELVDRVLVLYLIVMAIFTLGSWIY